MTTGDLFADLDGFVALPRVAGLWLSPDGRRLVVGVSVPNAKKTKFVSSLWEVDPDGERPARRLTRSDQGENGAAFTPDGDLLFVSARPVPDKDDDPRRALWRLPHGGEAELLAAPPGGVGDVVVAREAGTVVLGAAMLPSATDPDHDRNLHDQRGEVAAILHDEYPVRFWDHDLGPARTRLLAGLPGEELRDITGHVGRALHDDSTWDVTPDGGTVVASWAVGETGASQRNTLVAVDVATGERRVLADDVAYDYTEPRVSPDGTAVAVVVWERPVPERVGDSWLAVVSLADGTVTPVARAWDRWPTSPRWTPAGDALVCVANDHGHAPLWRVDVTSGEVTRLTEDGAYSSPRVAPDGTVYALRAAVDHPPTPYRVTASGVTALRGPVPPVEVPGRVTEVTATAEDGTPLRAWLALPEGDEPAPLLLWIHGGPLNSWNDWHWRWNPWVAVARGYAVLLPDPALSTGYGLDFIQRGWGQWGGTPYTDLMAVTDAAVALPEIDGTRTAAMGGSYGGYMANWVAGHTDRFTAIVTHASLWHMGQMGTTTDWAFEWVREMTPESAETYSPHRFVHRMTTPMLVIHGDKDYRVPIGQAMTMWWDLTSHSPDTGGAHKFLYFPDEGHWVMKPEHVKVWYGTVLAFLAHHLNGEDWQPPAVLG
ncbi:prolyl oligopeptidase family serine peptidase [Actinophytocola oryzae]|uniref:Dipeptidyl aminopeptidase/acylaminoacyl peptidase n=1 Tax=Actinophytocola oryzae TaxID=502181 RepID=A0A4R7UZB2_9PSEU|nr:prolyl oligopeptidase family serine peptidase [Actinophytocola oryzae]TDV42259.1 dipeptidyl aminopeptidase/acylaminoacyl peptidase [Actinophytocola oryzae]